ncbi:MAG: GspE/PulE family protein [Syntrophomonadaceae bacterium]|jgi:type IV pilus assembly protein PilB
MNVQDTRIREILWKTGMVSDEQYSSVLQEKKKTGEKIGQILVRKKFLTKQQLLKILGYMMGIPHKNMAQLAVDIGAVKLVQPHLIHMHKVLPISRTNDTLTLAMADPLDQEALDDVRMATGLNIMPVLVNEKELDTAISHYLAFSLDSEIQDIFADLEKGLTTPKEKRDFKTILDDDAPIIRIVNSILNQAVKAHCSDVHIEPQQDRAWIRFRIDGQLYLGPTLPKKIIAAVTSRIKIMAGMDITEKRMPQDGRFQLRVEERPIDFRCSSLPTACGEKLVLRVLDRANYLIPIDQLGLSEENLAKLLYLANCPHGMILVTGPTGSGKTTTQYAILKNLNLVDKNIITLEDPVEYSIEGINQVQINPKAGLTFASGLKAILRQDPNVIMVGEIRDVETAKLAVHASLTGHLVVSTLHTNSAAGAVARLNDMQIEHYLLASSLSGIISQRLVRQLCPNCKEIYYLDEEIAVKIGIPEYTQKEFFRPTGCHLCRQLGYQGRLALMEVMVVGPEIKRLIHRGESSEEIIERAAIKSGMTTIKDDGIQKARQGLTSLEEVIKTVAF